MNRRAPLAALIAAGGLAAPQAADAAWLPGPEIVSVDNARQEQADGATQFADLSADARYVVLQTSASNFYPDGDADAPGTIRTGGIFRYDRTTGGLEPVADGDAVGDPGGALRTRGGANPSVSDDGRYVAFSTAQPLTPQDTNDNIDVYVRDMTVPLGSDRRTSGAYELVSALDTTNLPPSYEPRDPPLPGRTPGANVWPGQAISADGRFVAFRTVEQRSDLAGTGLLQTPPGTVFVRDLQQDRTTVVSKASADGSPVGNSEAPIVLSADGSTVAWVGNNAPSQVPFLRGESADDQRAYYLWRRWADLGAVTRRPTGQVDIDDPACPVDATINASDGTSLGPCDGPLTTFEQGQNSITARAPAISGDGYDLALLVAAGLRPNVNQADGLDLFTTSMRPGLTRKSGTRQLTLDTQFGNPRANGEIESIAMSRDGTRIAAITSRATFLLPTPAFQGAVRPEANVEPLMFDLRDDSIERIAFAPDGGPINGAALLNPSVSADGRTVAFTSLASNILPGDANELADAFVATFQAPGSSVGAPGSVNARSQAFSADATEEVELSVRPTRRKDGSVAVRVRTPVAGKVEVIASSRARPKPPKGKAPKRLARARRVASATRTVTRAGSYTLVLRVPGADGRRIRRGSSLTAGVTIRLTPRSGRRLTAEDEVTFRGTPAKKRAASKPARAKR